VNGEAVLRSRDGLALRARCSEPAAVDRAASMFVRPEKLGFGESRAGNRVEGTVRRRSFLGSMIRTLVDIAPAMQLTVDQPNLHSGGPEIGERVTVSWSVAHSQVLFE
jgi:ABC-type Fe3+/spermidine/putrescine transport system ATPase subunit